MLKTAFMLIGLASVFGASIACFGLFASRGDRDAARAVESCQGLEGQAKIDCQKRQGH